MSKVDLNKNMDEMMKFNSIAKGKFEPIVMRFKIMDGMLAIEQKMKASLNKHEDKYLETLVSSSNVEANNQNNTFWDDWVKKITSMETKIEELKHVEELRSNIKDMETMRFVLLNESKFYLENLKKWVEVNSKAYKEMEESKKAVVNVPTGPPKSLNMKMTVFMALCGCNKNCTIQICSDCKKKGYSCASTCHSIVQACPNKPDENSGLGGQQKRKRV